jgi:hypothetical protein
MKLIWNWIKNNPNRTMFLIPIILVAGISISHVVTWYDIANPINWAIYLSIAIEIGAMTALVAATNKIKGGVWVMFGLITFIQMIGNIFFSYQEIDENSKLFKSWVELTLPVWDSIGVDVLDVTSLKRWLAFLEGGLLPIISLTSLHFFTKYNEGVNDDIKIGVDRIVEVPVDRIVEVPVDRVVDRIVEVPVDRVVDRIVEVPVDRVVDRIVEVPVDRIIEKIVEIPVDRIIEKIVEIPVDRIIEKIVQVPVYINSGENIITTTTTLSDDTIKRLNYVNDKSLS